MIKRIILIVLLVCGVSATSDAQTVADDVMSLELLASQRNCDAKQDSSLLNVDIVQDVDTAWEVYPHPLCIPLMYLPMSLSFTDTVADNPYSIQSIRHNALRYITANHPELYVSVSDPNRMKKIEMGKTKIHKAVVDDNFAGKFDVKRILYGRKSYWRKGAYLSLQITQNYATPNWYQGAVNTFAMLGSAKAYINYKRDNISWENTAEWRVGVSTISGDTLHKVKITDDRFQIYTKFGYQVHKKWYVSMFADFKTNLFPNVKTNLNQVSATFLTPIRYSMGAGVDCKILKGLTINLSPATYKMVYAFMTDPERINVADLGIEENKNIMHEIGSSVRLEWKWKPLSEIELETKFYFFTNYKQIETELEIDVDFIINRYMSAKLILHPRYDGTIEEVTEQKSKLQFKELISVGFAHTFR